VRYRPLDARGDYTVGVPFLVNSPDAVAQAIQTRLKLWQDEWFLDTTDGTPWNQQILGQPNNGKPDAAIKQRILGTTGVSSIVSYSSSYDSGTRALAITATVDTIYGQATVSAVLK
jgi:hypothetical protein